MSDEKSNLSDLTPVQRLAIKLRAVTKRPSVGDVELQLDIDELDEYHLEKAERELRETPEQIQESYKVLGDMLADEEDLYVPLEEEFLRRFLRPCKWYPRSAFKLIKRYYDYRRNHPEFFENLLPLNERMIWHAGILTPLPRRCADGVRVIIVESGKKWNPKEVTLEQMFRGIIMSLEAVITEPKTQVSGVRVIVDMDGLSLSQVSYFSPSFARAIVEFVQRSLTCRLKGVHIVNQSFLFDMVYAFFKPFLHGKLRDRIFFHGVDYSSLLTHVDSKVLPTRYGGELETPNDPVPEDMFHYVCAYQGYFEEMDRYGYVTEI